MGKKERLQNRVNRIDQRFINKVKKGKKGTDMDIAIHEARIQRLADKGGFTTKIGYNQGNNPFRRNDPNNEKSLDKFIRLQQIDEMKKRISGELPYTYDGGKIPKKDPKAKWDNIQDMGDDLGFTVEFKNTDNMVAGYPPLPGRGAVLKGGKWLWETAKKVLPTTWQGWAGLGGASVGGSEIYKGSQEIINEYEDKQGDKNWKPDVDPTSDLELP